jgi:hypothetical protein
MQQAARRDIITTVYNRLIPFTGTTETQRANGLKVTKNGV